MRKGMSAQIARPVLTDRNPIPIAKSYAQSGIAPHGQTSRWTYTVPAGRKFLIGACQSQVTRSAVAAPAGLAATFVQYTPSGGSLINEYVVRLYTNVVGDSRTITPASGQVANAGDLFTGLTQDGSTGGAVDYDLTLTGTEGDA